MTTEGEVHVMDRRKVKDLLRRVIAQTEKEAKRKKDIVMKLRTLADELDMKQKDMNIAKIAFASGGIVGSGLTVAGIIAAPFTFGASLGLTIGGIAVGVSSGLGGAATTIADWIINSNTMKEAQAMMDDYQETVNILVDLLQQVKNRNSVEFQRLVSEELSNMDATQRLTLESILNGMKTSAEVVGSVGRTTAVAGAVVARATVAAGRTMMETLETSMKVVKIGGVVLSVLTVPLDLHAMISNSIKIHKNAPSETSNEIRKLAKQLEKYRMVSSPSDSDDVASADEVKTLKQEVEKVIPDLQKMEEIDEGNRRRKEKLNRHLKRLVEKVPTELNQLALKYDQSNASTNVMKFLCLLTQMLGTTLVLIGIISGLLELGFDHILSFGVMVVIGSGVLHFMLEMYTELTNSSIWRDADTELERYMHTIQVLTDLERGEAGDQHSFVEDTFGVFRSNLHNGFYTGDSHWNFTLIAVKLLLDVCVLVFAGSSGTVSSSSEPEVLNGLISLETAISFVAYPVSLFADMQIGTGAALMYILSLPLTVYLLTRRLDEMRGKSKSNIADAMKNLSEDFTIRFQQFLETNQ